MTARARRPAFRSCRALARLRRRGARSRLRPRPAAARRTLLVETRRDRIEHLDPDRAGIAADRSARPEQPGIERDRQARNAHLGIEMHDPVFVLRLGAGRPARAFRKDDDLAIALRLRAARTRSSRRAPASPAAIDRDHAGLPGVPAEKRDPHQLALHDVGGVGEEQQQRKGLPQRLMLGGHQKRPRRNFLHAAKFDPDAADRRATARDWCAPRTWPPR